jgi:diguanylate cyclase (GGDEF)-like protein
LVRRNGASQAIDRIDILNDTLTERERNTLRSLTRHAATVTNQFLSFVYLLSFAGLVLLVMAAMSAAALRRSFRREQTYREELRRRAETDDLTGVANRRQFLTSLQRAIDSARASNRPLAFALIDLDNFKRVNDNHGHAAGDEVLRQIAETSLATIREGDLFGRLGGEEFGLILPMTAEQHAMLVCERLREQVHGQVIELNCGVRVSMTMSAGIAQLRPSDTISSLMEQADRALYLAKRGGRDQVKLATSEGLAAAQELNAPIALEQIKKQPRSFTAIAF